MTSKKQTMNFILFLNALVVVGGLKVNCTALNWLQLLTFNYVLFCFFLLARSRKERGGSFSLVFIPRISVRGGQNGEGEQQKAKRKQRSK